MLVELDAHDSALGLLLGGDLSLIELGAPLSDDTIGVVLDDDIDIAGGSAVLHHEIVECRCIEIGPVGVVGGSGLLVLNQLSTAEGDTLPAPSAGELDGSAVGVKAAQVEGLLGTTAHCHEGSCDKRKNFLHKRFLLN